MKLLKTENALGYFLTDSNEYSPVDKITKEDLLRLVNLTLKEEVEFDEYNEESIKHQAHQIVYKSILEKLVGLKDRKQEFFDQSERLFLADYEKYMNTESA